MLRLTKQEQQAVIFLLAMGLLGSGIRLICKLNCRIKQVVNFNENLGKINLNEADKLALMSVSGIGQKIAAEIMDYRQKYEYFTRIEDLKGLKGMTDKKYEKIKDSFFVE